MQNTNHCPSTIPGKMVANFYNKQLTQKLGDKGVCEYKQAAV